MNLESAIAYRLKSLPDNEKLHEAASILSGQKRFAPDIIDQVLAALPRSMAGLAEWASQLDDSASAWYVRARLAGGDHELAVNAWNKVMQSTTRRDPLHVLEFAKALTASSRYVEASYAMRDALNQPVNYSFFSRAEPAVSSLAGKVENWYSRKCRIALLGSSTTALLKPVLKALCFRDRIEAELYEGLYGSIVQEVLDPASGLGTFAPEIVFTIENWRDLRLPAVTEKAAEFVSTTVDRLKSLWNRLAERFHCHVVQFAYDYPPSDPYEYLSGALDGGRLQVIERINRALVEAAPSFVSILDTPALQREAGSRVWHNSMSWRMFQQTPAPEALPVLGEGMAAHCRAILGLARKVLVTDLDNTLWKGIIGEDGLDGIECGPDTHAGAAHRQLQQFLLDMKSRGILLAVASKNNLDDALLPFQKHPDMLLRIEDFASFEASWNDKVTSIREIARKLSLGLDSFVFIDDNPLEREWVRSQLPDVAVVELGPSVFSYADDLARGRYFFAVRLSAEDQARAEQYRSEAVRKHLQSTAGSLEEFLTQLELRPRCVPVDSSTIVRITQLINKTNQFNLTTHRYTEGQVQQFAADKRGWASGFHLSDRLGDYGIIGVMICVPDSEPACWRVDSWLMSCRVLGRQMEKFMFGRMIEAARERGIVTIRGVFKPTAKNKLVENLYDQFGFERVSSTSKAVEYLLQVSEAQSDNAPCASNSRTRSANVSASMISEPT